MCAWKFFHTTYENLPCGMRAVCFNTSNKIKDETYLLLDCKRYCSIRDMLLFKTVTKIDDIRKLSHENLISLLMNANDYFVSLRLTVLISSWFEMKDKLIWPFWEYWVNVMIYINVAIVPWYLNYRNYHAFHTFAMLYCWSHANKAHCCCSG